VSGNTDAQDSAIRGIDIALNDQGTDADALTVAIAIRAALDERIRDLQATRSSDE
jgi:hypothetical protein